MTYYIHSNNIASQTIVFACPCCGKAVVNPKQAWTGDAGGPHTC